MTPFKMVASIKTCHFVEDYLELVLVIIPAGGGLKPHGVPLVEQVATASVVRGDGDPSCALPWLR